MATTSILAQASPTVQDQLQEVFGIGERILQVQATAWDGDRTSYRIAVEHCGALTHHHKLASYEQSTALNEAVWAAIERGGWQCRPCWRGAGFYAFHADYPRFLRRAREQEGGLSV